MRHLLFILAIVLFFFSCNSEKKQARIIEDFNFNWQFARGEIDGAYSPEFNDEKWREVRLPHDWSVEEGFTQENGAGATAFLPGGIGWYRKSFKMPEAAQDKITWIEFDGVYNNATVWINGHKLGMRPYGYIPFKYDLSSYLNYGETENVIVVKADRTAYVDCRWYPGSGIYRNVKLISTNKVHIPQWGTFIATPQASNEKADVQIQVKIENKEEGERQVELVTTIKDNAGKIVGVNQKQVRISPGLSKTIEQQITIKNPNLWDTENPNLYSAHNQLLVDKVLVDNSTTTFGIRHIRYDAKEGFFLNGKNTLLKGVNLHHDGGLVGAAVPDDVWERRLLKLKEAGCNAIRTAHNPPSEAFLDLCDKLGFLVQDEAFDEFDNPKSKRHNFNQEKAEDVTKGYTEHFKEWAERDVKAMVLRDRNHPCIIMWSIGNEIEWTYPRYGQATGYWGSNKATPTLNYYWDEPPFSIEKMKENFYALDSGKHNLATTAQNLSKWVKEVDTTRPVTANLVIPSVSHFSGYTDALDIIGYSYRQVVYDYGHKNYPDKMILGTENFPRWHEWKYVLERPFIPGMFIWKGVGYLGESSSWPHHGGGSGLLNLAGFENPAWHHFKSFWNEEEPKLYLSTQTTKKSPYQLDSETGKVVEKQEGWWKRQKWGWQNVNEHWNYKQTDSIAVEAYTNCESVELFLNGESVGVQNLADYEDRILKWIIPYEEGELIAKGVMPDGTLIEEVIKTANETSGIHLSADKKSIQANNYDVVHIVAQLIDESGNPVKEADENRRVTFEVDGDCRILGVDNGDGSNVEGFNSNTVMTYRGKCLLIIQANSSVGEVVVTANSEGLDSSNIIVKLTR